MASDGPFQRTQEDPVSFFRLRALHLAPSIGVDPAVANEAVGILITAFGEVWLNEAAEDWSPSTPFALRRHPLGRLISTAGAHQLAEVLELTDYLKALSGTDQIQQVIDGLKAQYNQTLLQLAFAARVKSAGGEMLCLEPAALGGRLSDFSFRVAGVSFRAECYRPTATPDGDTANEMVRIPQDCLAFVRSSRVVYSIAVALSVPPTPAVRREITEAVRHAVTEINAEVVDNPSAFPTLLLTAAIGTISVSRALSTKPGAPPVLARHPSFPFQENDFDIFMRQGLVRVGDVSGVSGTVDAATGLSHAALWLPPDLREARSLDKDLATPLNRLARKLERKLAQARSADGAARVLIVGTWMASRLDRVEPAVLDRFRRKIVDSHDGVAAVILASRRWISILGRHGYDIRTLESEHGMRLPNGLLQRLSDIDRT